MDSVFFTVVLCDNNEKEIAHCIVAASALKTNRLGHLTVPLLNIVANDDNDDDSDKKNNDVVEKRSSKTVVIGTMSVYYCVIGATAGLITTDTLTAKTTTTTTTTTHVQRTLWKESTTGTVNRESKKNIGSLCFTIVCLLW